MERCIIIARSNIKRCVIGDELNQIIKMDRIKDIIEEKNRIPPNIVQKICAFGETIIGGVEFKLVMSDGNEFFYDISLGPGIADFLNLPKGYSIKDIKDVKEAARQSIQPDENFTPKHSDISICEIDDTLMDQILNDSKKSYRAKRRWLRRRLWRV